MEMTIGAPPSYDQVAESQWRAAPQYVTPANTMPTSKVQISISCKNLVNLDTLSKSDPCVFIYALGADSLPKLVGQTECIKNNLNPVFTKQLLFDYSFEEVQKMRFAVLDIDKPGKPFSSQDLIGVFDTTLGDLVGAPGSSVTAPLRMPNKPKKDKRGEITVSVEEVGDMKTQVILELGGFKLDKKDVFGKSDPFLIISRVREDNTFQKVHQTEVVKKNLNPQWKPIEISLQALAAGDWNRTLRFEVYDWDRNSAPDLIGRYEGSLQDVKDAGDRGQKLELINPGKKKGKQHAGDLVVRSLRTDVIHTFLDYVQAGFQLNLMVAVDFTASNGNPSLANSLHHMNPYQLNQYQSALQSVSSILLPYDSDKRIAAYGFGAKLANGQTSHCFPLNGNPSNPEVDGVAGLMQAYSHSLQSVKLYGPTNFRQILQTAIAVSDAFRNQYLILLILTDGVISDMKPTIDEIVAASSRPISIVIVGVGSADFAGMRELDGDDGVLRGSKGPVKRDIVQFVEFRSFLPLETHGAELVAETLREIPTQFLDYMRSKGIKPPR